MASPNRCNRSDLRWLQLGFISQSYDCLISIIIKWHNNNKTLQKKLEWSPKLKTKSRDSRWQASNESTITIRALIHWLSSTLKRVDLRSIRLKLLFRKMVLRLLEITNSVSAISYKLGRDLGKGTFGKVRVGTHLLTEEKVAVKILEKDRIVDAADAERVSREIKILKLLRHSVVV